MNSFRIALGTALMCVLAAVSFPAAGQDSPKAAVAHDLGGLDDFDFLVGTWKVHSRYLKERLTGSDDWVEFDGTIRSWKLMDGWGNVDDTVFHMPDGDYRGIAPRTYDPATGLWAIWWIDGRNPHGELEPPVKGRFVNGVGTFYTDHVLRGKPIRMRFIWSHITADSARWEQAFSDDGGKTWETNWVQRLTRVE